MISAGFKARYPSVETEEARARTHHNTSRSSALNNDEENCEELKDLVTRKYEVL